jgi:polyisoprenoid-binding protein YceI
MSTTTDTAIELPLAPGLWLVDQNHSSVNFSIRHLGLSKVRGRFNGFDARLVVGESLAESSLEATLDMASVDTGNSDRDNHLRSPDFFHVEAHPEIHFVSREITGSGSTWQVDGDVTILGETRPFTLEVEFGGLADFRDERHAGFGATGQLRRKEFGLHFNLPPGTGALLGDVVTFDLDVELIEPRN